MDRWVSSYCAAPSIKELHDWLVVYLQNVDASDIVQLSHGVAFGPGASGPLFSCIVIVRQR
jgi:hypothetical protein